jgi:hypothetical protein
MGKKKKKTMTEAEWQASTNLYEMLKVARPHLTRRKKQLLFLGFARRVQHLLKDDRSLAALEVLDRSIDGGVKPKEMKDARRAAKSAYFDAEDALQSCWKDCASVVRAAGLEYIRVINYMVPVKNRRILTSLTKAHAAGAAMYAALVIQSALKKTSSPACVWEDAGNALGEEARHLGEPRNEEESDQIWEMAEQATMEVLCAQLRDIVGNPYHPSVLDLEWLTPTVVSIAQRVYDEREFSGMPVLADALEDAGSTDTAILDHLRGPGPHVRGCWVLDLILGKE